MLFVRISLFIGLILFWWMMFTALFHLAANAESRGINYPDLTIEEWQEVMPLKVNVVRRKTRCAKKQITKYKFRCYRRLTTKKFNNDIRVLTYFIDNRQRGGHLTSYGCLGVDDCFGFGPDKDLNEVILGAWDIYEDDPPHTYELWKTVHYEDVWLYAKTARRWCKNRFNGKKNKECAQGYWMIKDPNGSKFEHRPRYKDL